MSSKTPVSVILGTHMVGDSTKDPLNAHFDDLKDVEALLDAFYKRGYRQLDTAANYSPIARGSSEIRLGEVGAASRFTIHTKVAGGMHGGDHVPSKVEQSIATSISSLKTSTVETMFLHGPDRETPFEDIAKAMNDAFQQGKFKHFGVSNFTAAEVQKMLDVCEQNGYVKPSVYEGHYNSIVRGGEKELFPLLRKHKMAFFAYSPAAGGLFTGNAATSPRWSDDNPVGRLYKGWYSKPPVQASIGTVKAAAEKYGISGHAAAVRWTAFHGVLDGKFGDAVIIGASKVEQVGKTLDALEAGPLPAELADALTAIYVTVEGSEPPYHV